MAVKKLCSIPECGKPSEKRGWCEMHYRRWQRHGDLNFTKRPGNGSYLKWIIENSTYDGEECLRWPFVSKGDGRPNNVSFRGRYMISARVMCLIAHGDPPTPKHEAAHSCGKGHEGCINPQHLSWKTAVENMADQLTHGTRARGEKHGWHRLTREQVLEIRQLYKENSISQVELAASFDVSRSLIGLIVQRKRWGWLQ